MKYLIFLLSLSFFTTFAQSTNKSLELVNQGVAQYQEGDFDSAITTFENALKLDKDTWQASYQLGYCYFVKKEYDKAIEYCDIVLDKGEGEFLSRAATIKGNSLDILGKHEEAVKTYTKALKKNKKDFMLYYNLSLTYYNQKNFEKAEENIINGLKINDKHASSHLILAYINYELGKKTQTILPLFNFLLLENNSSRSKQALTILQQEMVRGVEKKDDKNINITLGNIGSEFSAAEMTLSLSHANNLSDREENKGKTELDFFIENTSLYFSVLDPGKNEKSFWHEYYVRLFTTLHDKSYVKSMCYFIHQSSDEKTKIDLWIDENLDTFNAFADWFNAYERIKNN